MNANQLGQIVSATLQAFETSAVINRLNEFNAAFNSLVTEPNEAHQKAFNDKRNELIAALNSDAFRQFPNTWRTALEELGLYELLGPQLKRRINRLIETNQLTPVVARDKIKGLTDSLTRYQAEFKKIHEAFSFLKLGNGKLKPGDSILSILMPREYYGGELSRFAQEIEDFSEMAGWISEIATGRTDIPKVKELSSTEPSVLIELLPSTVLLYLLIVEKIQTVRMNTHKMKELKAKAREYEAGLDVEGAIQKRVDTIVTKELTKIHKWLRNTYKNAPEGRLNELGGQIDDTLLWLAQRLDNGYQIDGDAAEPDAADAPTAKEKKEHDERVKLIKEVSLKIKYVGAPREPVLMLPKPKPIKKKKSRKKLTRRKAVKKPTAGDKTR